MADIEIEVESFPPRHAVASTSTAASPEDQSSRYDIFLNHRGPDVKNTFASHLYRRLVQRGLRVFLDKSELQEGLNFNCQIQRAILTASVHVAIFSPRYAESKWCLDELLQMFESGAPIIPVFYRVKPGQVRSIQGEGGVYSRDLRNLEEKKTYDTRTREEKPRHDPTTIQKWREALYRVAGISGFELDANYTDEGELLDRIVERVVDTVKKRRRLDEAAQDSGVNTVSGTIARLEQQSPVTSLQDQIAKLPVHLQRIPWLQRLPYWLVVCISLKIFIAIALTIIFLIVFFGILKKGDQVAMSPPF